MSNNGAGQGPPPTADVWINGSQRAVEVISERFERNGQTRHIVYQTPAELSQPQGGPVNG